MAEIQLTDAEVLTAQATQTAGEEAAGAGASAYQLSLPNETFPKKMTRQELKILLMAAVSDAGRVFKDGDLTAGVTALQWFNGDTLVTKAVVAAQALTNNQTNYIYYTASGTLTVNITGFPIPSVTPHIRLATILTAAGTYAYTDITDWRQAGFVGIIGAGAGSLNDLDWQESVIEELDFTGAEPGAPTLGDRYLNTGTGASSVTAQTVAADDIEEWNGTNWTEITPNEGFALTVEDRNMLINFDGAAWVDIGTAALLNEMQIFFAATDMSGAEAETLTDGSDADGLHVHNALLTVEENTAGIGAPNVLLASENLKVLSNEGSGATNYHTLPTAAAGLSFTFINADATDLIRVVAAATDKIMLGPAISVAAGYIQSTAQGDAVILVALDEEIWFATSIVGTWNVEIA